MFNECRHIKPTGFKCKSPALRNMSYCYYHGALHRVRHPSALHNNEPISLPSLEDRSGVQIALQHILESLSSSRIDTRRAGLYLRGLRIAADLTAKPAPLVFDEPVRDLTCDNNGDPLALPTTTCEPPEDCLACNERDQCADFEDHEDEVAELEKNAKCVDEELDHRA